ncbi:MAG TPA: sulfurtransferase TusA family protein [Thermodesulfovibrionales bacterium]|nr:sulfurtransferase TusA family protein [Thermodesulfovibrionales bacterium]
MLKTTEPTVGDLDLRGTRCPMNFVKTKLKLDEIERGELLEIFLDGGDPIRNVPRSVEAEGHEVLHTKRLIDGTYSILVRRG